MVTTNPVTSGTATASAKSVGTQTLAGDFDKFLKLLTTQLQNQDPTAPLDANQFTTQLVQFAGIEQSMQMNKQIGTLVKLQQTSQVVAATSYIGKTVDVASDKLSLAGGKADFFINGDETPKTLTVQVLDQTGRPVRSFTPALHPGIQRFTWDGKNSSGGQVADGTYTIRVSAQGDKQQALTYQTGFSGTVSGVASGPDGAMVTIGTLDVPVDKIIALRAPTAASGS
jgi:flagellar basal-body rod modification protein FlgD